MAGGHLSCPDNDETTFAAYKDALSRQFTTLMGDASVPGEPEEARMRELVTFTWELSLRALSSRGISEARKMLRLLSCFALGVGVPRSLLDLPATRKVLGRRAHPPREVLQALRSVGLIDYEEVGDGDAVKVVLVHPLVASITREQMSKVRWTIGPYAIVDDDTSLAPAVAVRLVSKALADLRRRARSQKAIVVGSSIDEDIPILIIRPVHDSDPVHLQNTPTLTELDNIVASPVARQLLTAHVFEMLQYESRDLSDRDLADLIRAAATCLLDLLDLGFSADAIEMTELIFDRLSRWGPDPMSGAAKMNLKTHPPDISYGRQLCRLI
jgi:hypothetical protein